MSTIEVANYANEDGSKSVGANYVIDGTAKAWLEGQDNATINDSFNVSSGTDNGTGDYTYSITNAFTNSYFSQPSICRVSSSFTRIAVKNSSRVTSLAAAIHTKNEAGTTVDAWQGFTAHGDLA